MTQERKPGMTRRQMARTAAAMAAGIVAGEMMPESEVKAAQMPAGEDPRIAWLAKERGVPYTDEQRKAMPAQLKNLDEGSQALRKFALPDGGGEPGFLFVPERGRPSVRK